jgi:hypothetical protein
VSDAHGEQQGLNFVNAPHRLGSDTLRPMYLKSTAKRWTVWFWSEEAAAYFVTVNLENPLDK